VSELSKELTEGPRPKNERKPPPLTGAGSDTSAAVAPVLHTPPMIGQALLCPNLDVRVDYLALSFPARKVTNRNGSFWKSKSESMMRFRERTLASCFPMDSGSVNVSHAERINGASGYISFNPSTIIYGPKTPYAATAHQTLEIVHRALDEVAQQLEINCPRDHIRLSRLDLCVTISPVSNIQQLLLAANECSLSARSKNVAFSSNKGIESVRNMMKKRTVQIYDKSVQARLKSPTVRFEVSLKRAYLRDHCKELSTLTEDECRKMFVSNTYPWIARLAALPALGIYEIQKDKRDYDTFLRLLGLAYLEQAGIPQRLSPHDMRRMRELKKKHPFESLSDLIAGSRGSGS